MIRSRLLHRTLTIGVGLAVVVALVKALPVRGASQPHSTFESAATTASTSPQASSAGATTTTAAPDSTVVDPSEPPTTALGGATTATLAPRPTDVRLDPAQLAARFVAEWLTYPSGPEAPSALAARISELVTNRYRGTIEGLSAAGRESRPGSVAVMGATSALDDGIYRVTAWQAQYGSSNELVGPLSWDVMLVSDSSGGWLVDGLRRAG
jgi:hypothetical protein